jgi:MFS family permease
VRTRFYYGWVVTLVAAAAMVGTLPGRTQGLGLITEPLLADLQIDRVTYATINLWATLAGAAGALGVGRALDRWGSRIVLAAVACVLGFVVMAMSQVASVAALAASLVVVRAVGQGALSVVSIAMVGHWFERRIDAAMAVYSIALSIGFMAAFPIVGAVVQSAGWRTAWLLIGIALVLGLAPAAWMLVRSGPESIGSASDRVRRTEPDAAPAVSGYALTQAMTTPAFWIFAIGAALYGLVASGIGLFNESILTERGFGANVYHQTLAVTAITALAGNFLGGWLSPRVGMTRLMAIALFVLAAGLASLPHVSSLPAVMAWAMAMGIGGGLVMVLFFSVWPAVFGRRHLGRIQGVAQALTVVASALGPLMLAWWVELNASYAGIFRGLSLVVVVTGLAALLVAVPRPMSAAASDLAARRL